MRGEGQMKVKKSKPSNQLDHKVGMTKYSIIYANYTEQATAISVIHYMQQTHSGTWLTLHMFGT